MSTKGFSRHRRRWLRGSAVISMIVASRTMDAQSTVSPKQRVADSLLAASAWPRAAAMYQEVVAAEPTNGSAWTNLGESSLRDRKFNAAVTAFAKAESLRFRPFMNIVNQARTYAEQKEDARALELVKRVIDGGAGAALRGYITGSTEFNRLGSNAQWQALLASTRPCMTAPYHEFDFWIGRWDVQGQTGAVVGHNDVTVEQDGCLLVEHWSTTPGGQTGSSFNYYDVRDKKWHQLYIDNSGNAGAFPALTGEFTNGRMVMLTADANNILSRWTWYVMEPGKVKQMAEVSRDHGATWQTTWNSVYVTRDASKR